MNYRNIAYGILAYYWVGNGIFTMDLPTFLPDNAVSFLTAGCVGWLYRDHSQRDSDEAIARSRSPRLLTHWGDFSWDGVTDVINVGGEICCLFFGNGINYDGWFGRGDIAIIAPKNHIDEIGQNRIIKTNLRKTRMDKYVSEQVGEVRVTFHGLVEHDVFGKVADAETIKLEQRNMIANEKIVQQRDLIDSVTQIVGDTAMVGQILNPASELTRSLHDALAANNGDDD